MLPTDLGLAILLLLGGAVAIPIIVCLAYGFVLLLEAAIGINTATAARERYGITNRYR